MSLKVKPEVRCRGTVGGRCHPRCWRGERCCGTKKPEPWWQRCPLTMKQQPEKNWKNQSLLNGKHNLIRI